MGKFKFKKKGKSKIKNINKKQNTIIKLLFILSILILVSEITIADEHEEITEPIISEIMYNPEGDDNKYEFIEIYSEKETNIGGTWFEGIDLTFPQNFTFSGHIIIAKSLSGFFERYNIMPNFTYSGSLSNSGEKITLWKNISGNNTKLVEIEYQNSASEGYSIVYDYQNKITKVGKTLHGTPFKEEPIEKTEEDCDYYLNFNINKRIIQKGESIEFSPITNYPNPFNLTYWIEDINGKEVKKRTTTSNTAPKTFTPKTRGNNIFVIRGELTLNCNSETKTISGIESFGVQDSEKYLEFNVKKGARYGEDILIDIESSNNDQIIFVLGDIINISITPKEENVNKYINQEITIPLPDNCNNRYNRYQNISIQTEESTINKEVLINSNRECNNPKINKIYTLSKKFEIGKKISYYVSFENQEKEDKINLYHNNNIYTKELSNETSPLKFEITLEKENILRAEMRRGDNILDVSEEVLILNETQIESEKEEDKTLSVQAKLETNEKDNLLVGKAVKETKSNKKDTANLIPNMYYAFLGLSLIGNIILMWKN